MKNSVNMSRNVNSILNTYKCFFFQTAADNLRSFWTASTIQDESTRQSGNAKAL